MNGKHLGDVGAERLSKVSLSGQARHSPREGVVERWLTVQEWMLVNSGGIVWSRQRESVWMSDLPPVENHRNSVIIWCFLKGPRTVKQGFGGLSQKSRAILRGHCHRKG